MGDNETFAQVADNSDTYITTFREMAQMLRGIYGELLINSQYLRDNSRRDWFLPDEDSMFLNSIITDFMKRLHKYRYCASKYFSGNHPKKKAELKKALDELVDLQNNKIDLVYFYKKEKNGKNKFDDNSKQQESYSNQDMPHENKTMKKHYDIIMRIIKFFFRKEKKIDIFAKLRAFIANQFKK